MDPICLLSPRVSEYTQAHPLTTFSMRWTRPIAEETIPTTTLFIRILSPVDTKVVLLGESWFEIADGNSKGLPIVAQASRPTLYRRRMDTTKPS